MNSLAASLAAMCLAQAHWTLCENRYQEVYPLISESFAEGRSGDDLDRLIERNMGLAAYERRAIPIYLRHLRENPKSADWTNIALLIESNNLPGAAFLPYAIGRLGWDDRPAATIRFIGLYGSGREAKAISGRLLVREMNVGEYIDTFECLKKIGGKDDTVVLTQFIVDNISKRESKGWRDWGPRAIECRKAIESRLEAESKDVSIKK